jgi:lysozyme
MVTFMGPLVETLKRHEGVRSHVYKCTEGFETIAVGRNISESGIGLSDDEIEYLLMNDIERCDAELRATYDWYGSLGKPRRDAMINLSFNLGLTRLRGFVKAIEAMSREQYDVAADEFMDSRWASQVGDRAVEVTELIRSGEYR